ncbi:MAG: hypothetical protein KTR20_01880, partial [Cellvibrionaceae bacterium]|nr:hypothetical protein [Cellvibrionaceae bacterium]
MTVFFKKRIRPYRLSVYLMKDQQPLGAVDLSLPPLLESKKAPIKARGTSLVGLNERRATLSGAFLGPTRRA